MLTRRKSRENAFIVLFSTSFGNNMEEATELMKQDENGLELDDFAHKLLRSYENNAQIINSEIELKLKGWNVKRLQKVNLAILRLAVTEMIYGEPEMDSVIINEAVELAKRFGDAADYQFINGVLGNISRQKNAASEADL